MSHTARKRGNNCATRKALSALAPTNEVRCKDTERVRGKEIQEASTPGAACLWRRGAEQIAAHFIGPQGTGLRRGDRPDGAT
ncbi:MAG: hypothetical protein OHK0048_12920 [Rhodoferax sp.]